MLPMQERILMLSSQKQIEGRIGTWSSKSMSHYRPSYRGNST